MTSRRRSGDDGATLIAVLIIVTVIAAVMGVILSLADTSVRVTVALRDQAGTVYSGDGAAQVAINQLQQGTFTNNCSSESGTTTNLGTASAPFYPTPGSTALNASVRCTPDPTAGVGTTGSGVLINASNDPAYALFTTGTSGAEDGQAYAGNTGVCIAGGSVWSNTTIRLAGQGRNNNLAVGLPSGDDDGGCSVQTDPSVTVQAAATKGCNGAGADSNTRDFSVTPCTHGAATIGAGTWKTFAPVPSAPISATHPAALCYKSSKATYAAFRPGLYDNATQLNKPCSGKAADFEWFTPGTYYFDFGTTTWSWPSTLVGGTPQDSDGNVISSLLGFDVTNTAASNAQLLAGLSAVSTFPGSCADPAQQSTYGGVEFVFGGSSTVTPNSSGNNEICATYSSTAAPVAIYGVSAEVVGGTLSVTGGSVSAEKLCQTQPCTSASSGGASLIQTDSSGQGSFYVQGLTYAPSAPVSLTFKNSYGQLFGWGLVVRSFALTSAGVSSTAPFIVVRPAYNGGVVKTYTYRYLTVWTCAASASPCSQAGTPNLRVKVQGSPGSTLTVLSWSTQN